MVTIVSDTKEFIFIHIPKCAGASITKMIQPLVGWDVLTADIEAGRRGPTGRVIREHAPLALIKERYPEELDRFARYQSYAITRAPDERFLSSVAQHMRSFHNTKLMEAPASDIARIIDDVLAQMSRTPLHVPPEYIHFTRQVDYIRLDGKELIGNLYRIETLNQLVEDLSARHEMPMTLNANKNETSAYRSEGIRQVMQTGGALARQFMPIERYRQLRRWARDKVIVRARDQRPAIFESATVQDFVRDFYAEDRALWQSTARPKPG